MLKIAGEALHGRTGHEAGRELLERMYREETGEILPEIAVADRGKPYFTAGNLHFSISHTEKHAFCCLSRENVGIDGEEADRIVHPSVAEKFLSPAEWERYLASPDRNAAMLRLWVMKESYAKLTGRGYGNYLKETSFSPEDPEIQIIDGCYVAVLEG